MTERTLQVDSCSDYGTPFAVSVFFHGLILLLLFFGWNHQHVSIDQPPQYVQAHLVRMTAQAAVAKTTVETQPVKEASVPDIIRPLQIEKPELQQKEKLRFEKQKQEKLKQENLKKQKQEALEKAQEQQKQEQKKQENAEQQAKEKAIAEKRKADEALSQALADERAFQQSLSDKELAQSYADMIRRRVEQNWSRPPSAKKGMEVLLEIQLVPTGYVAGVSVMRGSGNSAFDLSAQQAVRKAEYFPEIKDVPSRAFEQHFRRFQMLFKVEDNF